MTIHYSVDSLNDVFNSEEFTSELRSKENNTDIKSLITFLDSIESNKLYHRTGLSVKNKKYRHKVSKDTTIIKSLKTSLNKMSSYNYETLIRDIVKDIEGTPHLYPLALESILEQSLLHHIYCKYYVELIYELHSIFAKCELLQNSIDKLKNSINDITQDNISEYDNLCMKNNKTDRLIGYSILICELEQKDIIEGYIHESIDSLINELSSSLSEEKYFQCCLCIQEIFKILYKDSDIDEMYKTKLTSIKDSMRFMKVKFKIMDILEKR